MATDSTELRRSLVGALLAEGRIRTAVVRDAFLAVPRERFVPLIAATRGLPAVYADDALVTRERDGAPTSSSSQPAIMAEMLEALDVRPGMRVLEVGLGTGYNAALLAELVGPEGRVSSIDVDPGVVADAARALASRPPYAVEAVTGDGREGLPAGAPYDRIIVTASSDTVPLAWWEQLVPGGLLVVPLRLSGMQLIVVLARTDSGFRTAAPGIPGGFMALRDGAAGGDPIAGLTARIGVPGERATDLSATGPGIAATPAALRGVLLGNLLCPPARRQLGPYPAWGLVWWLLSRTPVERQICVYGGASGLRVGLVDPAHGTAGLLVVAVDGEHRVVVGVEGHGRADWPEIAAETAAWETAGRPGLDRLKVTVGYPGGGPRVAWNMGPAPVPGAAGTD